MEQFIIKGPTKLKGVVKISGAKNAALPIIAASLLIKDKVIINNVPHIKDILSLISILDDLGVKTEFINNKIIIDSRYLKHKDPNREKICHLRASILLVSPLLTRNGEVTFAHPGGCLIGTRPFDVHLSALKKMGTTITVNSDFYTIKANRLTGAEVTADFSVTGTENIIMAAVLVKGKTEIKLAACEPHVVDLCNFLNKAGAKIEGVGTHNLIIKGVDELKSTEYTVIPDQIEAGTFAIAAVATKGEVEIDGFVAKNHESLLSKLDQCGVNYQLLSEDRIKILPTHLIKPFKIRTEIYPGFPTDLQAPIAVLATQANGTSEIYETIFEGRLGYVNELSKMGASCIVRDTHQASITGPTPLFGTRITSFDLRAGATLIIAALIAKGESRLDQIEMIDRGYEKIEKKFQDLGSNIKRVKLTEVKTA